MDGFDDKLSQKFIHKFPSRQDCQERCSKKFHTHSKIIPPLMGFSKKYLNNKISCTLLNTKRGKNWRCEIYLTFFQKTMDGLMTNNHKISSQKSLVPKIVKKDDLTFFHTQSNMPSLMGYFW